MRGPALVLLLAAWPGVATAQGSEFAVRGLGIPVSPLSMRAHGTAGGMAMFDAETSLNPASLGGIFVGTASFNMRQFWRSSENPFGSESGRDMQFPLAFVAGPLGLKWVVSVTASAITDRTFAVGLRDTVLARDVPVEVHDTLVSRGGLSDLRAAVAYRTGGWLTVGVGAHLVTGLNRIEFRRTFTSPDYVPINLLNELSSAATGFSLGATADIGTSFRLAGMARADTRLRIDLDTARVASQPMPVTLAGGVAWHPSRRVGLSGMVAHRTWSVADESIRERGGVGAFNTTETAFGIEWFRNRTQPLHLPLRMGVRYAQLPFPLTDGQQPHEVMVTLGTGLRMARGRANVDIALERAWRSDRGPYRERSFMIGIGVGVRP
jgi:hypothetical protein